MGLYSGVEIMPSSIVSDREEAARELVATLQLHGKRVGAKLAEIFEPLLEEGEVLPDYVLLQRLMARAVRAKLADLLAADEAHLQVEADLQIEEREQGAEGVESKRLFLRARRSKTEAERQQAIEAFDETYGGFGRVLEALYGLAGEEELAERLRPRELASDVEPPAAVLAEAEIPEPPEGDDEDQVQRRILSRRVRHPGMSRWLGYRIFRRRRARRR